ncbi:MAG: MobQ family relaxase [Phormidesmis sp.]
MAIFSMRMQVIGRSSGRSATAAAAYRSGEEIRDERTGKSHDYTGKSDIYGSEILLPEGAPERMGDRTSLWNEVERVEKRKDAQLSREVMIALPAELSHEQKEALAHEYVQAEFVSQGMIADICYHDFDSHNPHAHIMLTMRSIDEDGFGKKQREWNKRQAIERHRKAWEEYANRALEQAGFNERVDHRSLEAQGIEREPQIHLGAKVMEMESRGVQTRVGDESRSISEVNRDIDRKEAQREKVQVEIEAEQVQPETYILPDFFYSSESEIEVKQAEPVQSGDPFPAPIDQPPVKTLVPDIDLDAVRQLGELLVRRRDEIALENSPAAAELAAEIERVTATVNEVSAKAGGVAEKMAELLAKLDKAQRLADAKGRQSQLGEVRSPAQPSEKKQEPVQRQEPSKRHQKQRAKKRDQGMEM